MGHEFKKKTHTHTHKKNKKKTEASLFQNATDLRVVLSKTTRNLINIQHL